MRRDRILPVLLAAALLPACGDAAGRAPGVVQDTGFAGLVAALSEPGGYFDTDNLISNESSYLHALGTLDSLGVEGGVYVGVGPGQNFSYIAAIRPSMAFVVDIRRDNLLQHLWFRSLFEAAPSRLDYLCLMVVRRCGGASDTLSLEALVARVDGAPPATDAAAVIEATADRAAGFGVPLTPADLATIRGIHRRFADAGLALRFNTHGRAPRPYYPTLRRLILEEDRAGRPRSYLAREASYAFVRSLEQAGRVVPVVGDLAGPRAVRGIGAVVRAQGETVSAFYVSNVEFYLFGDGTFPALVDNLRALPVGAGSVVIRSVFRSPARVPGALPGHASAQQVHAIPALLRGWEQGLIRHYGDLIDDAVTD